MSENSRSTRARQAARLDLPNISSCRDEPINMVGNEAGDSVFDDFRHRTARKAQHWSTTGHRLGHDDAEWLLPQDRHQQAARSAE